YVMSVRSDRANYQALFDGADSTSIVEKRTEATVAPQALFLMNHPFVQRHARLTAERLLAEPHASTAERVARAWRLALGRSPTKTEHDTALRYLNEISTTDAKATTDAWSQLIQALFATLDFSYVH
ncbi:MAG: DUF1553 domain-containing protein, partial [Planctomycetia bacterium]|nr:DUF1553 domain-containing protein [Planctomycetia bacterium]